MKYAPHPWDQYGEPNVDPDDEEIVGMAEIALLEEEAEELRDLVSRLESDIEDLENELSGAEMDLFAVEQRLSKAAKPLAPGQTRHSEEF